MSSSIGSIKGLVADFGMVGIGASIANAAKGWADSVYDLKRAIGGTSEDASQLLAIGKYAGIGTEQAEMYFAKFGKAISIAKDEMEKAAATGKTSGDVFTRLGITFDQLDGKTVGDVFAVVAEKMRNMSDGADKDRIAMELFGRSGFQVTEMMNLTKEQIDQITEAARKSGLILNDETTEGWHKLGLEVSAAKMSMEGFAVQIGNQLLPALKGQLDAITSLIGAHAAYHLPCRRLSATACRPLPCSGNTDWRPWRSTPWHRRLARRSLGPWGLAASAIGIATLKVLEYIETLHKVPSYDDKAEVRQIGDDGMGNMLHQKKTKTGSFLGMDYYTWQNLNPGEEDLQRGFEGRAAEASLKGDYTGALTDQQIAERKAKALQVETPYAPPPIGGDGGAKAAERLEAANEKAEALLANLSTQRLQEIPALTMKLGWQRSTADTEKMTDEMNEDWRSRRRHFGNRG